MECAERRESVGTELQIAVSNSAMIRFLKARRMAGFAGLGLIWLMTCAMMLISAEKSFLRWRAERLLRDFQAIELHKTFWAQAQVLMWRWGAWGHYDGECTERNCWYSITLDDPVWEVFRSVPEWVRDGLRDSGAISAYQLLGGRGIHMSADFIVQDGTIRRTTLGVELEVPPHVQSWNDDYGYTLIAYAQSRSSLNSEVGLARGHWILGGDEQLAEHPYYKGGRPGGCEGCMEAEVTYSVTTPQAEIRRLIDFDLSCITRWWPCTRVEQLMPAAKPWHLYQLEGDPPEQESAKGPATTCSVPIWARGRDALAVYSIEVVSTATQTRDYSNVPFEIAKVHRLETLKGPTPWTANTMLNAYPFACNDTAPPYSSPECLEAGKRYLALIQYSFHGPSRQDAHEELIDGVPGIRMESCGLLEDTPANRAELARGFAMNDELRAPYF